MEQGNKPQKAPAGVFLSSVALIFILSLSAADSVGFVPYYIDGTQPDVELALSDLPELGEEVFVPISERISNEVGVSPERILIPGIGLDLSVQNPSTTDIDALDVLLKNGPARYVDSALAGGKGNILIFAHSSNLPVVHNQMYKAFNRVSELEDGDIITLIGGGKEYVYSVRTVRRADAEDEIIDLSTTQGKKLTLVTCDTLTSKSSRWIVEAEFVGAI